MRRDEAGFTLVEVSVTLLLIGIVFAAILSFLSQTQRITATEAKNVEAQQTVSLALRQLTQDLRGATRISPCDPVVHPSTNYGKCITFQLPRAAGTTALTTCACPECCTELRY